MQVKKSVLCGYTVLVVGLRFMVTHLYHSWENTPDRADDIFNGRNWVGNCVKLERSEDVYQLQCSSLTFLVKARDYDRALRAWELTGEIGPQKHELK